jgi:hypothetical protein
VLERREKPSDIMVQTSVLSFYLYEKGKYQKREKSGNDIKDVSGKRTDNK